MTNPIIGKVPAGKIVPSPTSDKTAQKHGPSRFDQVRGDLESRNPQSQAQLPPEVTKVSADQQKLLESDLRKRLQQSSGKPSPELFQTDMAKANQGVDRLKRKVEALPKQSVFDPLRLRFDTVEAMYKQSGNLVKGINSNYSPAEMMQVQLQMYQLTENLELLVKAVEQTNTGVKTILQTQV